MAFPLGKKLEESATHRWILYIRGPNDEDLSCFIEKVVFVLHPSFNPPIRGYFFTKKISELLFKFNDFLFINCRDYVIPFPSE